MSIWSRGVGRVRYTARQAADRAGRARDWLAVIAFNRAGGPSIVALGDSHAEALRGLAVPARVSVTAVRGATAQGIVNPASKTNALERFERRLRRAKPRQIVLTQLGEVDCGFVIWYRAEKHGVPVDEQLRVSLENYLGFLEGVRARGFRDVWVLSAPLPTIPDGFTGGEVAHARRQITATLRERTELTDRYNELLRDACRERGLRFLDATSAQRDPLTGVIRDELRHADEGNHHLDERAFAELVAAQVRPLLA